jgi:hypothetical protein
MHELEFIYSNNLMLSHQKLSIRCRIRNRCNFMEPLSANKLVQECIRSTKVTQRKLLHLTAG